MEKKLFEISNIENNDKLNALSIALNAKEQVSHIKIDKLVITFNCLDVDALMNIILDIDKNVVVKEIINGKKRTYNFNTKKDTKRYFMFKNITNQQDIIDFVEAIKEDERFQDVEYDQSNQILTLTSSKDVLNLLRKKLYKISPSASLNEHRKPVRSSDVFNQTYVKTYLKVALFALTMALALITSKDDAWITPIFWTMTVLITAEQVIKSALKQFKLKKLNHPDVYFFLAIALGIFAGHYIEIYVAVLFHILSPILLSKVLEKSLYDIDDAVTMPEVATILKGDKEEQISLYEFAKGDILIVHPDETIPMPGHVVKGETSISTYSNTSTYDLVETHIGDYIHSGDINVGKNNLYIEVSKPYTSSRYIQLMNMAESAPTYETLIQRIVKKISRYYTPIMFGLAIVVGVVLPAINFKDNAIYLHMGAVLMYLSASFSSEESSALGNLAGFAKAFNSGIVIESSKGLDSINITNNIIYDRYDGMDVTDEELALFKKLSHLGKKLIIFNDGPFALESDQYTIYNSISLEEKLEVFDSLIGETVYIGDSYKDITLLQKSFVGITRGGLSNRKVVENSDIVLIDSKMDKVYETFVIARRMRTQAIINLLINISYKVILMIALFSFDGLTLGTAVLADILASALIIRNSTSILG